MFYRELNFVVNSGKIYKSIVFTLLIVIDCTNFKLNMCKKNKNIFAHFVLVLHILNVIIFFF